MTVLLGDSATGALSRVIDRAGRHWAKRIVNSVPMTAVNRVNKVLGPRFVTKYGTKQGVLVLSKQVPFGVGAVLGGSGNHLFGRGVVASARKIFGALPSEWPAADAGGHQRRWLGRAIGLTPADGGGLSC
jgi:hypothetical protein